MGLKYFLNCIAPGHGVNSRWDYTPVTSSSKKNLRFEESLPLRDYAIDIIILFIVIKIILIGETII